MVEWIPAKGIFPNGGMAEAIKNMEWNISSVVLHNRWFAPSNNYLRDFPFLVVSLLVLLWFCFCLLICMQEKEMSLPLDTALYKHIMSIDAGAKIVYEQDWLGSYTYRKNIPFCFSL